LKSTTKDKIKKEALDWTYAAIYAIIFGTIIRLFVFETMMVPTESMVPTVEIGDRMFIEKITYQYKEPQTGDVVVFWTPYVDQNALKMLGPWDKFMDFFAPKEFTGHVKYVKRLVGKPGDTVKLVPVSQQRWDEISSGSVKSLPTWMKNLINQFGKAEYITKDVRDLVCMVQVNGETPEEFKDLYYLKDAVFSSELFYEFMAFPAKYKQQILEAFQKTNLRIFDLNTLRIYNQTLMYEDYYNSYLKNLDLSQYIYRDTDGLVAIKVPEGFYFFMGDNSPNSFDSRFFGYVPVKNVIGTPFLRIWPLKRAGTVY
jgi:signal peptidase I